MRVLLVYPYFIEERIHDEDMHAVPIGLYAVAAALEQQGHETEIVDWHDRQGDLGGIREELLSRRPDLIGFSILNGNRWGGIDIAREARKVLSGVRIVFGGVGATFLWRHLLEHFPEIDFVVIGEGDRSFPELAACLEDLDAGAEGILEEIPGIAFRKGKEPFRTRERELVEDLDSLPIPAHSFTYPHVTSTRGCAWRCAFCGSPRFWGGRIRFRSPENFVDELAMLYNRGVAFFYVSDDAFTADRDRTLAICKGILERGLKISWNAISRVDCVDEEILYWMRRAGCIQISYGVESGSKRIRKALNKRIREEDIQRAFDLTVRTGILTRVYFIYGSPGETEETVGETIRLMDRIRPLSAIFYMLDVFPGTDLYRELKRRTPVTDDIWLERIEGILYSDTDPRLTDERMLGFGRRLREAFYRGLPGYAEAVELAERPELYERHADFLSRLAMTFTHGDYSRIESIPRKEEVAETLYRRSLAYAPQPRAFLGLGILLQKRGDYAASLDPLSEGVKRFPEDEDLALCLGISYMNLGDTTRALSCFDRFPGSERSREYAEVCRGRA